MRLALCCLLLLLPCTGFAAKVTYTSGPLGLGYTRSKNYVPGGNCGKTPTTIAWDKEMAGYNDSNYNPGLKPVTEVRIQPGATVQTLWGGIVGPNHGYAGADNPEPDQTLKLRPGEVIIAVSFISSESGSISNLTITTNASRTWAPKWPFAPSNVNQPFKGRGPSPAEWKGPPIQGDWYLAYTAMKPLGWCCNNTFQGVCIPPDISSPATAVPGWYMTPKIFLTWAADLAPPPPPGQPQNSTTDGPGAPLPNPPSTSSKDDAGQKSESTKTKPKSKGAKLGIIVGIVVGGIGVLLLAALVWIFCRHGGKNLAANPFMKSFSSALRAGGAVGGAAGGATGGVGTGGAAGGGAAATAAAAAPVAAGAMGAGTAAGAGNRDMQLAYAQQPGWGNAGAAPPAAPAPGGVTHAPQGSVAIGIPSQHTGVLPSPFTHPAHFTTPQDPAIPTSAAPPTQQHYAGVHHPTGPTPSGPAYPYAATHHPTGPAGPAPTAAYQPASHRPMSAPALPAQAPPPAGPPTALPQTPSDGHVQSSVISTTSYDFAASGPTGASVSSFPSFRGTPSTRLAPFAEAPAQAPPAMASPPTAAPPTDPYAPTATGARAAGASLADPATLGVAAAAAGGLAGGAAVGAMAGSHRSVGGTPRVGDTPRSGAAASGATGATARSPLWSGASAASTPRGSSLAGSAGPTGQLEPQRSTPVDEVVSTLMLAKEVLDCSDKVVANHARCTRLTTRIHSIVPLLSCLHSHMERAIKKEGGDLRVEQLQHFVESADAVFRDVKACICRWTGDELAGRKRAIIQVLRDLVKGDDEFLKLNERLANTYQNLIVALNVKHVVADHDPEKLRDQHDEDVAADLKGVAQELSTGEGEAAWESLSTEERATIREAFTDYGLNFTALMSQARQNAIGDHVKSLLIPWKQIDITEQLGSGGYGTVFRGTWNHIDVAVKKLQLTVVTERAKRELSHEAYVMSLLRHPNVATSYGLVLEPPHCALVMKYYEKGALLELLHDDTQPLTLRRKLQLATDVAKGMAYLHNRPSEAVIHGDLKPSNLLIDDDDKVVIADFGLSRVSTLTLTTRPSSSGMSVSYTAPEILADPTSRKTAAADVYAYGLVLFEIFTRELPFDSTADVMTVVQYVLTGGRPKVDSGRFLEVEVPKEVVGLMQQCWQQVPQARPGFPEILERLRGMQLGE